MTDTLQGVTLPPQRVALTLLPIERRETARQRTDKLHQGGESETGQGAKFK